MFTSVISGYKAGLLSYGLDQSTDRDTDWINIHIKGVYNKYALEY